MRTLTLLVGLLAAGLLAPTALHASAEGVDRPFVSRSSGVSTIKLLTGHMHNTSTGTATHFGAFTRVDLAQLVPHPGAPTGVLSTSTLTTANGDRMLMDCVGTSTSADNNLHSTTVVTCTVTGGTGRFTDATGSIVSTTQSARTAVDTATMTASYTSESTAKGTISY